MPVDVSPQQQVKIQLYPTQADFVHSPELYRSFISGIAAGKSFCGAYDLLRRAQPRRLYMVVAPSYPMLRDTSLRSVSEIGQKLRYIRATNRAEMLMTLGNGAEVIFRTADNPERLRGPNLSGAWLDEAALMPKAVYDIIIGRLRQGGESGWLSVTTTPKGKRHWTYDQFKPGTPNTALFLARTADNPFLPPEFEKNLRERYTSLFASQELDGMFVNMEGQLAMREWFPEAKERPAVFGRMCRFWDLAASTQDFSRGMPSDYTVGALLGYHEGVYWLGDVIRGKWGPGDVEDLVIKTAFADGRRVIVGMEQDPGSSGKLIVNTLQRRLPNFPFRAVRPMGDKVTRAMPLFAAAQNHKVRIIPGNWDINAFYEEVEAFPHGEHDDQIDAVGAGFNVLSSFNRISMINLKIG